MRIKIDQCLIYLTHVEFVGRGNVTILKIIATSLYMEVLKNVDVSCVFGHNN